MGLFTLQQYWSTLPQRTYHTTPDSHHINKSWSRKGNCKCNATLLSKNNRNCNCSCGHASLHGCTLECGTKHNSTHYTHYTTPNTPAITNAKYHTTRDYTSYIAPCLHLHVRCVHVATPLTLSHAGRRSIDYIFVAIQMAMTIRTTTATVPRYVKPFHTAV